MMAIDRTPTETAFSYALDPPTRPRRLKASTVAAIGVVAVLHAGLAAYLYSMKLAPLRQDAPGRDPVITISRLPPPTPPRPQPRRLVQASTSARFHHATLIGAVAETNTLKIPDIKLSEGVKPEGDIFQQTIETPPARIQNPDWLSRPTALQMTRYYPEGAMEAGVGGTVVLNCAVTATGTLTACQVISETPAGQGFAQAALKLAGFFRMSPRTENGQPVDGALVRIPLVFSAGD